MPHRPSCAAQHRAQAAREGWDVQRTAEAIRRCCQVSPLRAHRLARGWTLTRAVEEYRELARQVPRAGKGDENQLRLWETDATQRPRAETSHVLCRLYGSDAVTLGLISDLGQEGDAEGAGAPVPSRAGRLPAPGLDTLAEEARRRVDRTLAQATVSSGQLDLLEERVLHLRFQYVETPPAPMLRTLLEELADVQDLAGQRQPGLVQVRLSEMTATLATLIADALMKLGHVRQSRAWYATARAAAEDGGNDELRARVNAQAAMLPYYYGPLHSAVLLAREARRLSRRATATGALAAAAEARALARQGNADGALAAIRAAKDAFEACHPGAENDAFAFPERRMLLYLSGALTFLGRSREARQVQQRALALYGTSAGIDPALLRLEQAICLARDRSPAEACQLAQAAFLQVPEEHRTPILGTRARHVIEVLPAGQRASRAVRELDEMLPLPAGAR